MWGTNSEIESFNVSIITGSSRGILKGSSHEKNLNCLSSMSNDTTALEILSSIPAESVTQWNAYSKGQMK